MITTLIIRIPRMWCNKSSMRSIETSWVPNALLGTHQWAQRDILKSMLTLSSSSKSRKDWMMSASRKLRSLEFTQAATQETPITPAGTDPPKLCTTVTVNVSYKRQEIQWRTRQDWQMKKWSWTRLKMVKLTPPQSHFPRESKRK